MTHPLNRPPFLFHGIGNIGSAWRTLRLATGFGVALLLAWSFTLQEPRAAPAKAPTAASRSPAVVAGDIDRLIGERLKEAKVPASGLADDAEFIRRLSLDIRGRIPHAERVVAFLANTDPDKRAKLIDEFLDDAEYGEHFAIIWYHRIVKPGDDNRFTIANNKLREWLATQFNDNHGWNRIVTELLTASGDRDKHPETTFWLAQAADAKTGQPDPKKVTAAVSQLFLGVRLGCCECHNHPFGTLKQTDFWGEAAFFAQTHASHARQGDLKDGGTPAVHEGAVVNNNPAKKGAKKMAKAEPEQKPSPFGAIEIPYSKGKTVSVSYLDGTKPSLAGQKALRPVFAAWLTAPKNPYFARAAVNKLWANFFAHGIVTPVDDMRKESRNTHPELLTLLADEFAASNFNLKHLIRCICNSKTYQRTSAPLSANKEDETLFSHMTLKVMSADVLYDSLAVVLEHSVGNEAAKDKDGKKKGMAKKVNRYVFDARDRFRAFFHAEADDDVGVVEEYTHGIPQALHLMNSMQLNDTAAVVGRLMKTNDTPEKVIEALYLRVLSRKSNPTEVAKMKAYLAKINAQDPAKGYADLLWVLLNTSEFMFNH